jgi:hypothetical protein
MSAQKRKASEHEWQDDGLRVGGRTWQQGVRFVCTRCGLERRKIEEGQDRYYLRGARVKGDVACLK